MQSDVAQLEQAIRESIIIPNRLRNNIAMKTTGLGGVFIQYASDSSSSLNVLNSKVSWTIAFDTTDGAGRYIGQNIGVEMTHYRDIKPMRGIKTLKPWQTVVGKVNKWMADNEEFLFASIVNK